MVVAAPAAPVAARRPYAHQVVAAKWLLDSRNHFAGGCRLAGRILADDMGLGKTFSALLAAKVHKKANPAVKIVVLCQSGLIRNWKAEARLAGVHVDFILSNHSASFPEGREDAFVVIVDEAQAFQNPESARTRKFLGLCHGVKTIDHVQKDEKTGKVTSRWQETVRTGVPAESVYLLTGTPVKNGRPHNLLPLLQAINHGIASRDKVRDYLFRYCGPKQIWNGSRYVTSFDGATNLDEFHELTKIAILYRKTEDCIDLPELTRTLRPVDLSAEERREYETHFARLESEYRARLKSGKIKAGGDKLVLLNQLRLAGSVAKVGFTVKTVREIIARGGQVVIFTCFKESATKIAEALGVPVYSGDTSLAQRDAIVQAFQAGTQPVFVGVDKAGGVGLTLHAFGRCRHVFLVDRPWTPGDALQLEKRAHRIGQTNAVSAQWLQHGQIDDTIDGILDRKAENIAHILDGTRTGLTFATEADIADEITAALGWDN